MTNPSSSRSTDVVFPQGRSSNATLYEACQNAGEAIGGPLLDISGGEDFPRSSQANWHLVGRENRTWRFQSWSFLLSISASRSLISEAKLFQVLGYFYRHPMNATEHHATCNTVWRKESIDHFAFAETHDQLGPGHWLSKKDPIQRRISTSWCRSEGRVEWWCVWGQVT